MNCRMPDLAILHYLLEFAQTYVHWVSDAIQPSHLLLLLILWPSIFLSIRVFSKQTALHIRWKKYWTSASASVLPMNIQGWFPLRVTGLYSLISKGFSGVFSSTTAQKHHFFSALPSLLPTVLQYSSRKTSISALLIMPKPLTLWITINCGKFWKSWEYQTTWPASWVTYMQVRKQQLELAMGQQTGSK